MGDFDDITNILDDLANFDVAQFEQPKNNTPAPKPTPAPVVPSTNFSISDTNLDFGLDQFETFDLQPTINISSKNNNNNNNFAPKNNANDDMSLNFDISDSALGLDFELPPTDFDLPPTDIDIEPKRRAPPSRAPKAATPTRSPTTSAQPMNAQPMNAQPMNMQPMNMQPMNAQPMNMQPMNAQPMNSPGLRMPPQGRGAPLSGSMSGPGLAGPGMSGPGISGPGLSGPGMSGPGLSGPGISGPGIMMAGPGIQAGPTKSPVNMPMNAQPMNMQPMNAQPINMQPMNMQPMNAQPMNMKPMNMQPMNAQPMNMQPMNAQPMNMQPMNAQPINMQPMNMQPMNMQPMNAQPVNMQPMNARGTISSMSGPGLVMPPGPGPNRVSSGTIGAISGPGMMPGLGSSGPLAGPGIIGVQPMNMQPMNMQPMNMQPMNMQPMNIKKQKDDRDLDQTAEGFTFKEASMDEEWPDPIKKEIEPRALTEGREKLVLTLVLSDKSTKKVFATDDFTISDLRDLFANKLYLWQTEFFNLCVKESEEERWLDLRKTIAQEKLKSGDEVLFKIKFFKTPKKLVDETAIFLFYLQVKQNIISSSYPCPEKLAVRLAAHQVQINFGNYVPAKHRSGFMGDRLQDYLPSEIIAENNPDYLENRIYQLHKTLLGKSNKEVMEAYLDQAQQIQCYGSAIFWVKEKGGRTKKFAIAEDGVLISTDDNPKRFNFISFKNLSNWKLTEEGFQIATIEPHDILEFVATEFKSKSIIELMCSYYVFLLGVDPGELPLVRLPMQPEGLPNPKMFHKPNTSLKRNISDITFSRLELFKESYMKGVKKLESRPHLELLTQIDTAIDQDLVLDSLDVSDSNFTQLDLRILADSISTAFDYEPKEGEFFEENMTIATLNLSFNDLIHGSDGADSLGKIFAVERWQLKNLICKKIGLNPKAAVAMNSYIAKNLYLESIDVEDNNLQIKGASSLLKSLKGQDKCGTFNFNGNNLSGQVCFFLAQVLAKNQNVYELHIGNNKLDDKSLTNLVEGLKRNRSLTVLDVRSCDMGAGGGRLILKWLEEFHNLRTLYIGGNNLGTTWGSALVKLLNGGTCTLTSLDVSKNGLSAKNVKGILTAIKETHGIRELDISYSEVDKACATLLSELISSRAANLRKLFVRKCGLPKAGGIMIGQALQQNTTIRELDYSGNEIKDGEVGKSWADAIRSSQTLEILHLCSCGITPEALTILAPSIAKNTSIEKMHLDGNKLAKAVPQLGEAIAGNTGLKYLSCKSAGIDLASFGALMDIVEANNYTLKVLDLTDNGALAKADLSPFLKKISFHIRT